MSAITHPNHQMRLFTARVNLSQEVLPGLQHALDDLWHVPRAERICHQLEDLSAQVQAAIVAAKRLEGGPR